MMVHLFIHLPPSYHHPYLRPSLLSTALVCTLTYYLLLLAIHAKLQPTTPLPSVVLAVLPHLTLSFIFPPLLGAYLASSAAYAARHAFVPPTAPLPYESSLLHLHHYLALTLALVTWPATSCSVLLLETSSLITLLLLIFP